MQCDIISVAVWLCDTVTTMKFDIMSVTVTVWQCDNNAVCDLINVAVWQCDNNAVWHDKCGRSRPDSFISMESDIASEQDRSENIEVEVSLREVRGWGLMYSELSQEAAGPSSSTPLKDSTPTNDVCDNINNVDEEENMDHEAGDKVVQIGEIVDEKDIVESSDC